VNAYALRNKLAAYQSVSVHGGVATEDPHRLVLMLMDGALERIAEARGCIEHGDIVRKAKFLSQAVHILTELRSSLDLAKAGIWRESRQPLRLHDSQLAPRQRREQSQLP